MGKRSFAMAVLGFAVIALGAGSAKAEDPTHKLGRGLANTFLGVLEVPNQIKATYNDNGGSTTKNYKTRTDATVRMLTVGPIRGIRDAVKRTGYGLWDTVTFMSPGPGDLNYGPRMTPEFIEDPYSGTGGGVPASQMQR